MNTASLNTKSAPLLPSSTLLDKRWKEHDYLLHQYKLRSMRGLPAVKPTFNRAYYEAHSPPSGRKLDSAKPTSKSYFNPITPRQSRPKSKDISTIYGGTKKKQTSPEFTIKIEKRPLFRPVNEPLKEKSSHRSNKPKTSYDPDSLTEKEKSVLFKNLSEQPEENKPKPRPFTCKNKPLRPLTSKQTALKRRPVTSIQRDSLIEEPPLIPQRQRWVKSGKRLDKSKSAYGRDVMDSHFKKHQYYKNLIRRQPQPKRLFTSARKSFMHTGIYPDDFDDSITDKDLQSTNSLDSDSSSDSLSASASASPIVSPSPSPTPSPPLNLDTAVHLNYVDGPVESSSLYLDDVPLFNGTPMKTESEVVSLENVNNEEPGQCVNGSTSDSPNSNNPLNGQTNSTGNVTPGQIENNDQLVKNLHFTQQNNGNRKISQNDDNVKVIMAPNHLYYKSENFYLKPSNFYPLKQENLKTYIPPSQMIKIIKDTDQLSDSSFSSSDDDEPVYVLRDGKPGKYVENKGKFVRMDNIKSRKKIKKELKSHAAEAPIKNKKRKIKKKSRVRRVSRIGLSTLENKDGIVSVIKDTQSNAIKDTNSENSENINTEEGVEYHYLNDEDEELDGSEYFTYEDETDSNVDEKSQKENMNKKKRSKRKVSRENNVKDSNVDNNDDVEGMEGDDEYFEEETDDEESEDGEEDEESTEEIAEKKAKRVKRKKGKNLKKAESLEHYLHEVENNNDLFDFDVKNNYDSDRDQYGRRKDRLRPSSSLYDMLPPLNPDLKLDDGDVNKCKVRLLRDTVILKESLDNPTTESLETALDVVIKNNNDNRRWLRKLYRDEYMQSLLLDIRKNLPVDIGSVISYMMIPVCEFDAMCLWDALKGLHKDPEVLSEILCTRNNKELDLIREAYSLRYGEELIDHIEDETLGSFQRILMMLALGQREEKRDGVDRNVASIEARKIHALMEGGGHHLESLLIEIFSKRPIEMLRSILNEYRLFKGNGLDIDLIKVLSKDFSRCIITIMWYIQNPPNYYCDKLHDTHFNGKDDDKALCRILLSRSERDMEMIKGLFFLRYGMELVEYVAQVCHGNLKGLALRLIEPNADRHSEFQSILQEEKNVDPLVHLSLSEAIKIILRKTKVVSKCIQLLNLRKERLRHIDSESSDTAEEFELEPEGDHEDDKEQEVQYDSAEEEERAAKEAQKELRDGLKNISFSDNVQVEEINPKNKSVFDKVSFAAASRGILKNGEQAEEGEEDGGVVEENIIDKQFIDLDEELLNNRPAGPKMTQLNGPVLDPTFVSRDNKIPFKKLGKTKKFRGTVKGIDMSQFNALKDAQAIGKAMLQKNRNVEGILLFLTTRNNAQRQLIIREFFRRYRRDLVDDLRILAPQHEDITLSLLLSGEIYDSASLYAAVNAENVETKDVFIEILCSRQNDELAIIKRALKGIFNMNIEDEISKFSHGNFRKLLVMIADCVRDEGDFVDVNIANKDSQALYEAIIKKPTNYDVFIDIFGTRSFHHIAAVCDNFSKITHVDLLEIIDETLEGDMLEGIIAIICNVRDASMYFCERIYRSMAYEQIYSMLIRCVVSRAEIDLQAIKAAFRRTYGRTVYSMIDKDCDLPSKKILLNVVKK